MTRIDAITAAGQKQQGARRSAAVAPAPAPTVYKPWVDVSFYESDYSGSPDPIAVQQTRRTSSKERYEKKNPVREQQLQQATRVAANNSLASLLSPVAANKSRLSGSNHVPMRPPPFIQGPSLRSTASATVAASSFSPTNRAPAQPFSPTRGLRSATSSMNALVSSLKLQQLYRAAEENGWSLRPQRSPAAAEAEAASSYWPFLSSRPPRISYETALRQQSSRPPRVSRSSSPPASASKRRSLPFAPVSPYTALPARPESYTNDSRASHPMNGLSVPPASPFPAAVPITHPTPLSAPSFASMVGNTSLIYLRHLSAATGCAIYGKAEFENPGGSIKDRPALAIVAAAEAAGELVPGEEGWIVEGTAGNTGIGLTLAGASRGYKTIIVMADNNSQEKKDYLRSLGAILIEVPMVPFKNPNNYVHVARRVFESLKSKFAQQSPPLHVILADQWSNEANRNSHFEGTGPEIYEQTSGTVDAFCCGVGTGGSLSGISLYLKSRNPAIQSVLIDPSGSALKDYFESGELKSSGSSFSEGIGQGRLCDNLIRGGFKPDLCLRVTDEEALPVAYDLLEQEGISIGSSSCVNVAGAVQLARRLGPGHTIVTLLCDGGSRYQSKMYNPSFLREKKLPLPHWLDDHSEEGVQRREFSSELKRVAMRPLEEVQAVLEGKPIPDPAASSSSAASPELSSSVNLALLSPKKNNANNKEKVKFEPLTPMRSSSSPAAASRVGIVSFGNAGGSPSSSSSAAAASLAQEFSFQSRLESEREHWNEEKKKIWEHYATDINELIQANKELTERIERMEQGKDNGNENESERRSNSPSKRNLRSNSDGAGSAPSKSHGGSKHTLNDLAAGGVDSFEFDASRRGEAEDAYARADRPEFEYADGSQGGDDTSSLQSEAQREYSFTMHSGEQAIIDIGRDGMTIANRATPSSASRGRASPFTSTPSPPLPSHSRSASSSSASVSALRTLPLREGSSSSSSGRSDGDHLARETTRMENKLQQYNLLLPNMKWTRRTEAQEEQEEQ